MKLRIIFTLFFILSIIVSTVSAQQPTATPKSVSAGVVNSKAVNLPKPEYPAAALAVKASGEVKVQVVIDELGNVISASAVTGHPLLRPAAEQAARNAKFKPTTLSGQPVKVTGVILYNFVPAKSSDEEIPFWGIGMIFSFLANAEPFLIKEFGEDELNDILAEMAREIPSELASEKVLFDKLAASRGDERRAVAAELSRTLRKYFNRSQMWEAELGENLGILLVEIIKHIKDLSSGKAVSETSIKMSLQKIKNSLLSTPSDASGELIERFRKIAAFADAPDLTSRETITELYYAIAPMFESFSDEND